MLLTDSAACTWEEIFLCIGEKTSLQSFWRICSQALFSEKKQSSKFSSANARYRESVLISSYSNLLSSEFLRMKLYYSSKILSLDCWRKKKPTIIGSLCSIVDSSTSYKSFFTTFNCNFFFHYCSVCPLIADFFIYRVSRSVHYLVTLRTATERLHGLNNNSRVWILVSFASIINNRMNIVVETFPTCVLNEPINFRTVKSKT